MLFSKTCVSSCCGHHTVSLHTMTRRCVMAIFISVTVLGVVSDSVEAALGSKAQEQEHQRKSAVSSGIGRREKRQVRASSHGWGPSTEEQQLYNILQQYGNDQGDTDLLLYTPTTPSPEDVNCHVEIPVTRRVGGKCVNLGAFTGCQAGIYLALDASCNTQMGVTSDQPEDLRYGRRRNPFSRRGSNSNNPFRTRSRP